MIKFNYIKDYRQYICTAELKKDDDIETPLVVDTGASFSVISPLILVSLGILSADNITGFSRFFREMNYPSITFQSLGGSDLEAFPCRLQDVKIGDIVIPNFFFYLQEKLTRSSLLGIDFIRFCSLTKQVDDTIIVDNFDYSAYEKAWLEDVGTSIFPLYLFESKYKSYLDVKNTAAAFRFQYNKEV